MTTQSPHLYAPTPARKPARTAVRTADADASDPAARRAPGAVQTRLPWWAVLAPVLAFAALLALISGGAQHGARGAASGGDLLARAVTALPDLVGHIL